ncbi:MAG: LuxR C-terminal-related transcriptional regulator [Anaerolineae bacterium]
MSTPLLKTKLYVPPIRSKLVSRPRLVERLDEGLRQGCKLVLISAPAGYGKTTLLSEWAGAVGQPVAWLSLDKGDNDLNRFMAYLLAALQRIDPQIGQAAQAMLQAPQPPEPEALLTTVINDMADTAQPSILVLDDYSLIEARPIHDAVAYLLQHSPPLVHLVLATRADPPLPIARLRGRSQLVGLYQADLRFRSQEVAEFLNRVMGLDLSVEDVAALEERTEGWIAGLQMAAVSMRGCADVAGFVRAFTGSHRYILDYLGVEVLRQQPAGVREFLLRTAILDRLTAPLCDAVLGAVPDDEGGGSQPILEYLEGNNLFIVPLDDERRWYRYHRLFADLLLQLVQRERPDLVRELHQRASGWHEDNGMIGEAIGHALAATDYEQAASLLERTGWEMLARGACTTLLGWLDAFPESFVRSRPQFGVFRAWCLAVTGQADDAESYLADHDFQQMQGEMGAVQAYASSVRGDARRAIAFAQQALEQLPEENLFLRGFLALNLGIAYGSSGEPTAASRALNQAIELSRATDFTDLTVAAMATLGHVQHNQAKLHKGFETHRDVLDLARQWGIPQAPVVGMAHLGIGEVLYEWNDLDAAVGYVTDGINLLEQGRFITYLLFGHSLRAQLCYAQGDLTGAETAVQQAEQLAQGGEFAYMTAALEGLRARLDLAQGNAEAAGRWAREHRWASAEELDHAREVEQIAVARVLVARDRPGEALSLLAQLLEAAEAAGRTGSVIKISALRSLAFEAQDDLEGASHALERALSLGEPEGYVRTFLDEGEPMARLLRHALSQGLAPNYVARLLAAFGEEVALTSPTMESLVEPLTERELEVLRLIVAGLSNPEIAEELFIAVSTVKSHVNHIYGKLGVSNRVEAVTRAQDLDLL